MKRNIHLIGNAHLDPIWLWRWQEGCGEVLQTFRSAVDRLNEYDDFIFTCSSAAYYKWVEDTDPALFAQIKELVKAGRWVPVNGWWIQPDCNMPSGESFARQALYSQLYYYEKFGRICKTGYNVDSFGHSRMLPQLIRKSGMKYYVMMRPDLTENPSVPSPLFWWHSPDGSNVLTYRIPNGYARDGVKSIDEAVEFMEDTALKCGSDVMLFYGVGNHGGGPTKGDIEHLISLKEKDGDTGIKFSSPDEYFETLVRSGIDAPVWEDDLQHHASGCYSATSLVKGLNRKAEAWLQSAEKWNTVVSKLFDRPARTAEFADAWRKVCFNQFHDILCGCSIMEAYDDVRDSEGYAMTVAAEAENNAFLTIAGRIDTWLDGVSDTVTCRERHHFHNEKYPRPVVVFNHNSFDAEVPVRTYHPSSKVVNSKNEEVLFQNVRSSRSNDSHKDTVFIAKVPALGYSLYWLYWCTDDSADEPTIDSDVFASDGGEITIGNGKLTVKFSKSNGAVSSIKSADGREFSGADNFCLPTVYNNEKPDTWAHGIFKFDEKLGDMNLKSIELVESGKLRSVVRTKHTYGNSIITQDFILSAGMDYIRVKAKAIWQEPLTILKIPFPVKGTDCISTYEVPAGFIKRPCNGEEEPALKWADISLDDNGRYGVTVLTDSKYSYSCPENELRLTAIRNSIFADHYSNRPPADFNYCDEGVQRFEYAVCPHTGDVDVCRAVRLGELFLNRPVAVPCGYQKGSLPPGMSFITVDVPDVLVTAVKFCEDGSGDAVIRARETSGKAVRAMIKCDMLEAAFYSDYYPLEIKTFRVDKDGYVTETDFLEDIPANA